MNKRTLRTITLAGCLCSLQAFAATQDATQAELTKQAQEIKQLQQQVKLLTQRLNQTQPKQISAPADNTAKTTQATNNTANISHIKNIVHLNTNKVNVNFYGQLNQAMLYSNDGDGNSNLFFVTNNTSTSRFGTMATVKVNPDFTVGGNIEIGTRDNSSATVSQINQNPGMSLDLRKTEVFLKSKKFGSLWLGKGDTSTNGTAEVDLSGTALIAYSSLSDLGGGLLFRNKGNNQFSSESIGDVYKNFNLISRSNRIRYITPNVAGFDLSTSVMADNKNDAALWYQHQFKPVDLAGAIGWQSPLDVGLSTTPAHGQIWNGSISALLNMGLNATLAGGYLSAAQSDRDDPRFWYSKLGYKTKWFGFGSTALSVDYGDYRDYAQNSSNGESYGIDAVQNVDAWNTAFYIGYRNFNLDQTGSNFYDINTLMTGVFFKF